MARPTDNLDWEFLLSRYLDGDLTEAEAESVRRRLESDASARRELAAYRALEGHLAAMGDAWTESDYRAQRQAVGAEVRRRLARGHAPARPWVLAAGWGSLAAAAAVVLALVASFFWASQPPAGPIVSVVVRPAAEPAAGKAELAVASRPVDESELPLAEFAPRPRGTALPAGTVLVSVGGPPPGAAAAAMSPFPFVDLYR